jgi:DNA-binding transcriptional LysR family regulator
MKSGSPRRDSKKFRFVIEAGNGGRYGIRAIDVKGMMTTNNPRLVLEAVKMGLGIGHVDEPSIKKEIAAKELIVLLEEWSPEWPRLCLYYLKKRHIEVRF